MVYFSDQICMRAFQFCDSTRGLTRKKKRGCIDSRASSLTVHHGSMVVAISISMVATVKAAIPVASAIPVSIMESTPVSVAVTKPETKRRPNIRRWICRAVRIGVDVISVCVVTGICGWWHNRWRTYSNAKAHLCRGWSCCSSC